MGQVGGEGAAGKVTFQYRDASMLRRIVTQQQSREQVGVEGYHGAFCAFSRALMSALA